MPYKKYVMFCIFGAFIFLVPLTCLAEDSLIWRFGLDAGKVEIDPVTAKREGIGAKGKSWIRLMGGARIAKYVVTEVGFGIIDTPDENPFTRTVTGGIIDFPRSAESEIVAGETFYSVGAFVPIIDSLQLEAAIGKSNFSATRKITNCSNCTGKTELNVKGGQFVQARLRFGSNKRGAWYLAYRKYNDGDLNRSMLIGFTVEYIKP